MKQHRDHAHFTSTLKGQRRYAEEEISLSMAVNAALQEMTLNLQLPGVRLDV